MTIKLYVDWSKQEILTKEEYEDEVKTRADDYTSDKSGFDVWLGETYSCLEIFEFTCEDSVRVRKEWHDACKSYAREDADDKYEEVEIEV
jgi:hypothetical protein